MGQRQKRCVAQKLEQLVKTKKWSCLSCTDEQPKRINEFPVNKNGSHIPVPQARHCKQQWSD
jgi:hypothetical protein